MRLPPAIALTGLLLMLTACATQRTLTVQTHPDADITVDGAAAGHGTITRQFTWKNDKDIRHVAATRLGYKEATADVGRNHVGDVVSLDLSPESKMVTLNIIPLPGVVSIDGRMVSPDPVDHLTRELTFTVDADQKWTEHTVSVERPGFETAKATIRWSDPSATYTLNLDPMRKNLSITTTPPGATVSIDGKSVGVSPVKVENLPFLINPQTNEWIPKKVTATKPGYEPASGVIGWDKGQNDYTIILKSKSKTVRIITIPPNAVVKTEDGTELPNDQTGTAVGTLTYVPIDDKGTLPTHELTITKKTDASEWYPAKLSVAWDDGKSDYTVTLKEVLTRPVPLVSVETQRTDAGWQLVPKATMTLAMKDVTEGPSATPPVQLLRANRGEYIDSLTINPNGKDLLYAVLTKTDKDDFLSQLRTISTQGTGGESQVSDGRSLELQPSYTPDGSRIIFSSNRAGRMSIWSMSASGAPGMTQLTLGDTNDLWPSVDANPKPRLYYERLVDTRPDPRLYMTQLGTTIRTDLTTQSGMQPRVNPKGDSVAFTHINPRTGKRDIYRMSDSGGTPENLTNTPDDDECDPVWNRDGTKIAFASDRGLSADKQHNYDIWVIDLSRSDRAVQVTSNGSWDDSPAWDPNGGAIYFRSNRGGEWGIWRINVARDAATRTTTP